MRRAAPGWLFAVAIAAVLLAGAFGLRLCVLRLPRAMRTAAALRQFAPVPLPAPNQP